MHKSLVLHITFLIITSYSAYAQDKVANPSVIIEGKFIGLTPALSDIPAMSPEQYRIMEEKARGKMLNPRLELRSYPYAATAQPQGPDPVWQKSMAAGNGNRSPVFNWQAQTSLYYPPDCNGAAGPNHFMQTINSSYAIYDKVGNLLAGPSALNSLFLGVTGSNCNDGDPVVLYDEQADRWFVTEFSICGSNDYMLMAVSTTNDPTGTWYKYSFDVADMPDYPKFGVWQDGYYMGTNNSSGNDIYVFQRDVMLAGGPNPLMVGFNNPWRPTTVDGFMCVPPLDNDGDFAPTGSPGLFITINDDAIGGGSDQLWFYELDVNWSNPGSSTFTRSQMLDVAAFDSNFGNTWDNIAQLGTSQKLDAIPMVIMNAPQYRNFGTYETIVCCHTVDVDASNHAGIRWYELRRTTGDWSVRQQGTFAPDQHSRWMGSVMLNGDNEIALGYSVSSSTMYAGIRYCGQSKDDYALATGILDVSEETIQNGLGYQSTYNRWGDYASMCVDPSNDTVFWFTSQYPSASGQRLTKIASFNISRKPGLWTGVTSSEWSVPSNWADGQVPSGAVDITIRDGTGNWPVFSGDLTLGTNCGNIRLEGSALMTISGNLTIGQGYGIDVDSIGTITIGGNWSNLGSFNPGEGTVILFGSSPSVISGKTISTISIANYSLDTLNVGMTLLSGASTGPSGDDGYADVTLPFGFYFAGTAYTTAHITTNGWVSLNGSGAAETNNATLFNSTAPNVALAPWFDDLRDDNTGTVNYKTEGAAPNRVFTVEWYKVRTYYTSSVPYARINFQVKLYESSNVIEFHYGSYESGNHNGNESASIGMEDAVGGAGHFIEATNGTTTVPVTTLNSLNNWPAVNYRFTPDFTERFHDLQFNKTSATVTVNQDIIVSGSLEVSEGTSLDIPSSKTINILGND